MASQRVTQRASQRRTQRASPVTALPWGDGDILTMAQVMQSANEGYTNERLVRRLKSGIASYNKWQPANIVMGGHANNVKNVNNIRSSLLYVAQLPDVTLNNLGFMGMLVADIVPFAGTKGFYQGVANKFNSTRRNLTHKR